VEGILLCIFIMLIIEIKVDFRIVSFLSGFWLGSSSLQVIENIDNWYNLSFLFSFKIKCCKHW